MNGNHALDIYNETIQTLVRRLPQKHLERMCMELELEMATYSQEVANYLQLLKAIKDRKSSSDE